MLFSIWFAAATKKLLREESMGVKSKALQRVPLNIILVDFTLAIFTALVVKAISHHVLEAAKVVEACYQH